MIHGLSIDERYFDWLYSIVSNRSDNPDRSHTLLCERLHRTPFQWYIRNDENRSEDGRDLRHEFIDVNRERHVDEGWLSLDTSVFEMMIALARRASFQTNWGPEVWFWKMLDNLELGKYVDSRYHSAIDDAVSRSIDRVIQREYEPSGLGGFFPLRDPGRDQREVELWYQLSAYLLENIDF